MRALVYHGPWQLGVEQVPTPVPREREVLVRVHAVGICGSDVHGFTGENGRRRPGQVMGHEVAGRVEAVGDEVPTGLGLTPGTPVTVNPLIACGSCGPCRAGTEQSCGRRRIVGVTPEIVSAFADMLVVPAGNVYPLSAAVPLEHGALVEPLAVGYHAARRGEVRTDDRVLVIGGGPIGQACILGARRLGATRLAVTEPNAARRSLAASLGAVPVDPGAVDVRDAVPDALGAPASVVIDAVGTTASLADAVRVTDFGARMVLVGMGAPRVDLSAYAISTEERTLVGSFCYPAREFADTVAWVGSNPPELTSLIDGRVGLDDAPQAFADLADGATGLSKVLVLPESEARR